MGHTRRRARKPMCRHHQASAAAFTLSVHAVGRFLGRVGGGRGSMPEARRELERLAFSARRTAGRTPDRCEVWEATEEPAVRFLVRREQDGRRTCVTVLAPAEREGDEEAVDG